MPSLGQAYEIVSVHSEKALNVSGDPQASGSPVTQATYQGSSNQQWYFKTIGLVNGQEAYQIVSVNSGKVLDVNGGSVEDGAIVQQWDQNGGTNQQWFLTMVDLIQWQECYQIVSVKSGKVLDVDGGSVEDGAIVQQWDQNGGTNQQWFLYPVGSLNQAPQIVVETKYMQNYRASSPVNGSKEIATVCETNGQTELFTVGSDDNITVFSPDSSSETGYRGTQLTSNLKVASLAAGLDSQGQVVVFAAVEPGPTLYSIVKTISSTSTTASWTAPEKLFSLAVPEGVSDIARVIVRNIAGSLYVALLWSMSNKQYKLTYGIWQADASTFVSPADDPTFFTLDGFWLGNTAASVTFANFSKGKIYLHQLAAGQTTYGTITPDRDIVSVDAVADAAGNDAIFAILDDNNAYQLSLPSTMTGSNPAYTWGQCSQGIAFQQIAAEVNSQGIPQIFAVSVPMTVATDGSHSGLFNVLYHWNTADAPMPASIAKSSGMYLGTVGNEQGDIDVFTIDAQNQVTHLFQEQQSENWTEETVEIPTGPIEEYCSYSTDITVSDNEGLPVLDSLVTIWASEEARITVNGATFFIDPYHSAQMATNSAGMLSISQEATSLAISSLQINLSEFMTPEESIVIQQYAGVQNRLATVTSEDLMNATVADGSYLLADDYRTPENTDSMAKSFNQCMNLVGAPSLSATTSPYLRKQGPKSGVWARPSGSAADLRKLASSRHQQHWQLSIDGTTVRYKNLTAHQAQEVIAKEKANPQLGGAFDWLDDVGDFFEGVVDEVIEVTNVIVSALEEGVEATISFVIDNVPYVFESVIQVIEQAFDLVQIIFAAFLVPYQLLFEWLAELFGWDDILRCKKALAYTANQLLGFMQGAAAGIQELVDSNFAAFQSQIASLFNEAISFVGQSTISGYAQNNDVINTVLQAALSNNFLYNKLLEYMASASSTTPSGTNTAIHQLQQQVADFLALVAATPAFTDAITFCENLASNPDQLASQLLATLFRVGEELFEAGISSLQAILDSLLQLVTTLVASLQELFNTPWDIPFISEFYSTVVTNGDQLTLLDLVALIMAIPTNILGDTPFPKDADLTDFENSFNAQVMLQAAGFAPTQSLLSSSNDPNAPAIPMSPLAIGFLAAGYAACTVFNGFIGASIDLIPPVVPLSQVEKYWNYANYAVTFLGLACRFEWFFTQRDESDITHISAAQWSYLAQSVGGLLLLAMIMYEYSPSPTLVQSSNIKAGGFILLGLLQVGLISASVARNEESGQKSAWRYIMTVPWIAKLLRLSPVVFATGGESLQVLAAIDVLFNSTAAFLGYTVLTNS